MLSSLISYIAAAAAVGLGIAVAVRNYRSLVHSVFALGMLLFGVEALLLGPAFRGPSVGDALHWQWYRVLAASLIPAVWLAFSVSFGRTNYREFLSRWKWIIGGFLILAPGAVIFLGVDLFESAALTEAGPGIVVRLGSSGYLLYLSFLIANVLILMNLERTFRNATGHARWQIKFMTLGLVAVFGARVYVDSQAILFRLLTGNFEIINSLALLLGCLLMARSLSRARMPQFDFYLSHSFLYNSFSVLVVGIYFIAVGVVAKLAYQLEAIGNVPFVAFLVLLAVVGLAIFFLSDKLRYKRKLFISRHFKRPVYDYQKVWSGFTENTASLTNTKDLCLAISTLLSHTLDILSVSVWLHDEQQQRLELGSSTIFTENEARTGEMHSELGQELINLMSDRSLPIDLESNNDEPINAVRKTYGEFLETARIRYFVPLRATGELIGVITLGNRVMNQPLQFEDYELLRTIGDQSAAALLNIRLSESLRQAKELEAFQVMSAFFMHDLKNLASKLSLVTQNMPLHFDNEEFREDAMGTMSQSVEKIKGMCNRLSLLNQTLNLNLRESNVNELVASTIAGLNGGLRCRIESIFGNVPLLSIDKDQLTKVVENLLINANEATGDSGHLIVATEVRDKWVQILFKDNGCGMSKEFMEKYLFKPFQTTKKQGMGIGLFHCKTIVEAHGGRIEVESEEGKGTTFRVLLPVKG